MTLIDGSILLVLSYVWIFLRAYQVQVVVGGHKLVAFCNSLLLAIMTVGSTLLLVDGGWWSIIPIALGGGIGAVHSMTYYQKKHGKPVELTKQQLEDSYVNAFNAYHNSVARGETNLAILNQLHNIMMNRHMQLHARIQTDGAF